MATLPQAMPLDPAGLRAALAGGAHLIDGRRREAFAEAHIRGALNVELDEQFASYVGWVVPWNAPLAFVLPDPQDDALQEALSHVRAIGYDRVVGYLPGGIDAWMDAGHEVTSYPTAAVDELCDTLPGGGAHVLDVRQPTEWAQGIIPGSRTIFLADLPDRMGSVAPEGQTWISCRTGHRSAIAASLLHGAGYDVRLVTPDGVPDVLERCPPRRVPGGGAPSRPPRSR
jgi:hydroxyacylglutathione hydrolase